MQLLFAGVHRDPPSGDRHSCQLCVLYLNSASASQHISSQEIQVIEGMYSGSILPIHLGCFPISKGHRLEAEVVGYATRTKYHSVPSQEFHCRDIYHQKGRCTQNWEDKEHFRFESLCSSSQLATTYARRGSFASKPQGEGDQCTLAWTLSATILRTSMDSTIL